MASTSKKATQDEFTWLLRQQQVNNNITPSFPSIPQQQCYTSAAIVAPDQNDPPSQHDKHKKSKHQTNKRISKPQTTTHVNYNLLRMQLNTSDDSSLSDNSISDQAIIDQTLGGKTNLTPHDQRINSQQILVSKSLSLKDVFETIKFDCHCLLLNIISFDLLYGLFQCIIIPYLICLLNNNFHQLTLLSQNNNNNDGKTHHNYIATRENNHNGNSNSHSIDLHHKKKHDFDFDNNDFNYYQNGLLYLVTLIVVTTPVVLGLFQVNYYFQRCLSKLRYKQLKSLSMENKDINNFNNNNNNMNDILNNDIWSSDGKFGSNSKLATTRLGAATTTNTNTPSRFLKAFFVFRYDLIVFICTILMTLCLIAMIVEGNPVYYIQLMPEEKLKNKHYISQFLIKNVFVHIWGNNNRNSNDFNSFVLCFSIVFLMYFIMDLCNNINLIVIENYILFKIQSNLVISNNGIVVYNTRGNYSVRSVVNLESNDDWPIYVKCRKKQFFKSIQVNIHSIYALYQIIGRIFGYIIVCIDWYNIFQRLSLHKILPNIILHNQFNCCIFMGILLLWLFYSLQLILIVSNYHFQIKPKLSLEKEELIKKTNSKPHKPFRSTTQIQTENENENQKKNSHFCCLFSCKDNANSNNSNNDSNSKNTRIGCCSRCCKDTNSQAIQQKKDVMQPMQILNMDVIQTTPIISGTTTGTGAGSTLISNQISHRRLKRIENMTNPQKIKTKLKVGNHSYVLPTPDKDNSKNKNKNKNKNNQKGKTKNKSKNRTGKQNKNSNKQNRKTKRSSFFGKKNHCSDSNSKSNTSTIMGIYSNNSSSASNSSESTLGITGISMDNMKRSINCNIDDLINTGGSSASDEGEGLYGHYFRYPQVNDYNFNYNYNLNYLSNNNTSNWKQDGEKEVENNLDLNELYWMLPGGLCDQSYLIPKHSHLSLKSIFQQTNKGLQLQLQSQNRYLNLYQTSFESGGIGGGISGKFDLHRQYRQWHSVHKPYKLLATTKIVLFCYFFNLLPIYAFEFFFTLFVAKKLYIVDSSSSMVDGMRFGAMVLIFGIMGSLFTQIFIINKFIDKPSGTLTDKNIRNRSGGVINDEFDINVDATFGRNYGNYSNYGNSRNNEHDRRSRNDYGEYHRTKILFLKFASKHRNRIQFTPFACFFGCNFMICLLLCSLYFEHISDKTECIVLVIVFVMFFIQISLYNVHEILRKECQQAQYSYFMQIIEFPNNGLMRNNNRIGTTNDDQELNHFGFQFDDLTLATNGNYDYNCNSNEVDYSQSIKEILDSIRLSMINSVNHWLNQCVFYALILFGILSGYMTQILFEAQFLHAIIFWAIVSLFGQLCLIPLLLCCYHNSTQDSEWLKFDNTTNNKNNKNINNNSNSKKRNNRRDGKSNNRKSSKKRSGKHRHNHRSQGNNNNNSNIDNYLDERSNKYGGVTVEYGGITVEPSVSYSKPNQTLVKKNDTNLAIENDSVNVDVIGKHNDGVGGVGVGFGESVPFKSFDTNGNKDDLGLMYDKCKDNRDRFRTIGDKVTNDNNHHTNEIQC